MNAAPAAEAKLEGMDCGGIAAPPELRSSTRQPSPINVEKLSAYPWRTVLRVRPHGEFNATGRSPRRSVSRRYRYLSQIECGDRTSADCSSATDRRTPSQRVELTVKCSVPARPWNTRQYGLSKREQILEMRAFMTFFQIQNFSQRQGASRHRDDLRLWISWISVKCAHSPWQGVGAISKQLITRRDNLRRRRPRRSRSNHALTAIHSSRISGPLRMGLDMETAHQARITRRS